MTWSRRVVVWLGAVAVLAVGMAAGASGAAAHDELLSTVPANGAKLGEAPQTVSLTFAAPPLKGTTKLAASQRGGQGFVLENVTVSGAVVTATWPFDKPPGTYSVAWRSVGTDGHPLSGTFDFSFTTQRSPNPTPSNSTSGNSAPASATPGPTTSSVSSTEPASSSSTYWLVPTLVAVAVLVVAIAALFAIRRHRNTSKL